jgi:ribosomal protein S27AE
LEDGSRLLSEQNCGLRGNHEEALGFLEFDEDHFCNAVMLGEVMPDSGDDLALRLVCGRCGFSRLLSSGTEGDQKWEKAK